jgi:hypothetical protein
MRISNRRTSFLPLFALFLYLVPNLVQDLHRVWGHPEFQVGDIAQNGIQIHCLTDKCPVCVFEFNVVDQLEYFNYTAYLKTEYFLFTSKQGDQIQKITFHYYNLRGPPEV